MIVALGSLFFGGILLYAGITGKSVTALLRGDNQTQAGERSLAQGSSLAGTPAATSGGGSNSSGGGSSSTSGSGSSSTSGTTTTPAGSNPNLLPHGPVLP